MIKLKVEGKKEDVSRFMDFLCQHYNVDNLILFDTYSPATAFFNVENKGVHNETI